jgi:2-oxoglutarate dehydrogenase E1 component
MKLLLDAYRVSGHEFADTDPLDLRLTKNGSQEHSVIDYRSFGFTEADLDKSINVNDIGSGIGVSEKSGWTLRKLIGYL